MDVGIDPITMTEGGVITGELQVFTEIFIRVGGMITGIIGGEDNRGTIIGFLTVILIAIGVTGKETGIGTMEDLVGASTVDNIGAVETMVGGVATVAGTAETVGMVIAVGAVVTAAGAVVTAAGAAVTVGMVTVAGAVVEVVSMAVEAVPVVVAEPAVVAVQAVVAHLVSAEENPVYNFVPSTRDRVEDKAAKCQTAA
jgi:hypothetical protein